MASEMIERALQHTDLFCLLKEEAGAARLSRTGATAPLLPAAVSATMFGNGNVSQGVIQSSPFAWAASMICSNSAQIYIGIVPSGKSRRGSLVTHSRPADQACTRCQNRLRVEVLFTRWHHLRESEKDRVPNLLQCRLEGCLLLGGACRQKGAFHI